jgi:hypothetical protein
VWVIIVKVALLAPAATVTLLGMESGQNKLKLLVKDTTTPPPGAGPLSVTVPSELLPPTNADGFNERETSVTEDSVTVRVTFTV